MTRLLLLDADQNRGNSLKASLQANGYQVDHQTHIREIGDVSCVISNAEFIEVLLKDVELLPPLILYALNATVAEAVGAIKAGASEYLAYPINSDELIAAVKRSVSYVERRRSKPQASVDFPMIGSSSLMTELKIRMHKVASTESAVLIQGESGTGKELVARALHAASERNQHPLITLNCNAIPERLIEMELFGHDSGTLRHYQNKNGLIDVADGGTLFLDEVGELPPGAQARLLRVLQEGEVHPVGSSQARRVSVRLIAATHRNLENLLESGQFREDLYYRLNVVSLKLPPLRDRGDDIIELADWLLVRTVARLKRGAMSFSTAATALLREYHWPGNVRELENAIERAVILCDTNEIEADLLAIQPKSSQPKAEGLLDDPDQTSLEDYFVRFVQDNQDQFTETELAQKLGISRKSLWERRQRLNIPRMKTRKRGPRRPEGT